MCIFELEFNEFDEDILLIIIDITSSKYHRYNR